MKKVFLLLFIFLLAFLGLYLYQGFIKKPSLNVSPKSEQTIQTPPPSETVSKEIPKEPPKKEPEIPSQYDLQVPFVPQAPFGVWDELHNNACEEAAILLVHYFKKNSSLSKEQADEEIKKMVDYQIKKYGKHKDLTSQETADLAKEFYGYKNVKVKYDFSWEEVKREIVKGNPVIVPAAGRLLKNPYYRRPGPIYHMLVIRGYNTKEIITNDPGTRRGEKYKYSYKILDNAIHDWVGSPENIEKGKRVMIVLEK